MADVNVTETAIVAGTGAIKVQGQLGEASITQGMVLYQKASDNKWYIADCTSADTDAAAGFALGLGGADQWISILTEGDMTCDELLLTEGAAGGVYVLSESGLICPAVDLAADDYITVVGVATSATNLKVKFIVSGVVATAAA